MKTREDVELLKRQWLTDPAWDIEATEGFEAYHAELLIWRELQEYKWEERRTATLQSKAEELSISLPMAKYVLALETTIASLRERVEKLEGA